MVEREMIKREITPLAVGFLIMISLFAYHWFNDDFKYAKNADRTIAKEEAELLHEIYLRTRLYIEHNQGIPDSLVGFKGVRTLLIKSPDPFSCS